METLLQTEIATLDSQVERSPFESGKRTAIQLTMVRTREKGANDAAVWSLEKACQIYPPRTSFQEGLHAGYLRAYGVIRSEEAWSG